MSDANRKQLVVMVNGLPGSMGVEVAAACLRRGYMVADIGLSGSSTGSIDITSEPTTSEESSKNDSSSFATSASSVRLLPVTTLSPQEIDDEITLYRDSLPSNSILIVVDYTHPSAVNQNCELYARLNLPFVMGTTGGDRDKLLRDATEGGAFPLLLLLLGAWCCFFFCGVVFSRWFDGLLGVLTHTHTLSSFLFSFFFLTPSSLLSSFSFFAGVYAVIAANMCKQIVALQTVLETISSEYPGAFSGYSLKVEESHQSRKADTSGTAKEMVK